MYITLLLQLDCFNYIQRSVALSTITQHHVLAES